MIMNNNKFWSFLYWCAYLCYICNMKYNGELNVIDTQEKAYLLGFLYGDGTITTYKEKTGRIRFLIKISINIIDKELIEQLNYKFSFFNLGKFNYSKYNKKSKEQISIAKSSKELYDDLILNGLYPRKSYENKDKLKLPNIEKALISHFIRGFFDADGSVYIRAKRKNLIIIEFCSVSLEFLNCIDLYLKSININSWKIITKQPKGKGKQEYFILSFIKTSEILKLIDFMYCNANIYLKRKADKCLKYKPINKVKDRNLVCPHCGDFNVWKNGIRENSTRYKCQNCKKGFSIKNNFNYKY
jgi:intein-encoded DNA endonuclease-like protein